MSELPGNGEYKVAVLERDVTAHAARFDKIDDSIYELRTLLHQAVAQSEVALNTVNVIGEQHTRQLEAIATMMLEVRRELVKPVAAVKKPNRRRVKTGAKRRA